MESAYHHTFTLYLTIQVLH